MRSRRADYSESTKQALVDSASDLFTKNGYAATSLDAIVKRARVTKGALYHHFSGKQALFEAAFHQVEKRAIAKLTKAIDGDGTPWERALDGVQEYIRVCLDPTYQRLVIREAPVVMGYERWRECEERYSFGIVRSVLESLIEAGELGDVPIEVTARMMFASLAAGAQIIAEASDPKKASAEVFTALIHMIEGIRRDR
ncbi:TetR family transcriptional regulator [Kibdelosporangium philippinense]|uniref:TetR family transcriptional regulator n=1 Tax=Kibdelosporangium philippinense TaxID=211113 RepID=A0ABS8ZW59_9PSEU|nr:TetR/AcrR family transcriptional regulator [Kibdelosporangium philippinense]MCE7011924.1 TetR family transcriptional regulator [Kibdelosporangium philippinense]